MSTTILRAILLVVILGLSAGEYAALNGMFDQTYYNIMHSGCANTPLGPDRNLCPPQSGDNKKYWNGIFFPPATTIGNRCLVQHPPQPDVEIDPRGDSWTYYTGCKFVDMMAITDSAGWNAHYLKSSDHSSTTEVCPIWITEGSVGTCKVSGTP